ncbi:MAG: 4'-phosphopantetheinyl transferase superfamily protein [Elusimicrobia bacterium]|nr:4'-phosphopantetheinyl transferase superfamily protein [Elusimicrobiota bacterium]
MTQAAEVVVHLVDLAAESAAVFRHEALLSRAERERAASFRFPADRRRYVCMHGRLREILSGGLRIPAQELAFREGACGKPGLAGGPEFSISASGDQGLIAVACVAVGVDIEAVDGRKFAPEMIGEAFGPQEREAFSRGDPAEAFFSGWVRKESVVKALGSGLSLPLKLVDAHLDRESFISVHGGRRWYTCDLEGCGPGYRAALTVACPARPPAVELRNRREEEPLHDQRP